MALYLRDELLSNYTITEDLINQLIEVLSARANALHMDNPEKNNDKPSLIIIFRFDEKGYRIFTKEDLLRHFRTATDIERLSLIIETPKSIQSNRADGEYLEINFNKNHTALGFLTVAADDSDWVDSSFSAIKDVLYKYKNNHGLARSTLSTLTIQSIGVISGFTISLWAASSVSPQLKIENSFIITFLFVFVLFSNLWGIINNAILNYVYSLFPSIYFYRNNKDKISWFKRAIIGGIAAAITVYVLSTIFSYIGSFLSEIPK